MPRGAAQQSWTLRVSVLHLARTASLAVAWRFPWIETAVMVPCCRGRQPVISPARPARPAAAEGPPLTAPTVDPWTTKLGQLGQVHNNSAFTRVKITQAARQANRPIVHPGPTISPRLGHLPDPDTRVRLLGIGCPQVHDSTAHWFRVLKELKIVLQDALVLCVPTLNHRGRSRRIINASSLVETYFRLCSDPNECECECGGQPAIPGSGMPCSAMTDVCVHVCKPAGFQKAA